MSKSILRDEDPRAELLRVMSDRIGRLGLTANRVKVLFGRNVSASDLQAIKEGDEDQKWGFRRLSGFARDLGIEVVVYPVLGPVPTVPPVAERYRRSA